MIICFYVSIFGHSYLILVIWHGHLRRSKPFKELRVSLKLKMVLAIVFLLELNFGNAHLLVLLWRVIQTLTFQSSLLHLVVIFRLNIV